MSQPCFGLIAPPMLPAPLPSDDRRARYSWLAGYAVAVASTAVCVGVRALLSRYFHDDIVLLFFVPALLVSAAVGGKGPDGQEGNDDDIPRARH